jgi:hypothetical protein
MSDPNNNPLLLFRTTEGNSMLPFVVTVLEVGFTEETDGKPLPSSETTENNSVLFVVVTFDSGTPEDTRLSASQVPANNNFDINGEVFTIKASGIN